MCAERSLPNVDVAAIPDGHTDGATIRGMAKISVSLRSPVVGLIEMSSRSHAIGDFSGVAG